MSLSIRYRTASLIGAVLIVAFLIAVFWSPSSIAQDPPSRTKPRLEIDKSERRLVHHRADGTSVAYRIGLGFAPTIDKTREGDGATPEGRYTVCVKNPESRFYLSLGLDYPNPADAAKALERGEFTKVQQQAVDNAHRRGRCPPWDTALGGEIYIHGHGAERDWTLGCVALDDADMKALYEAVQIGTVVDIRP